MTQKIEGACVVETHLGHLGKNNCQEAARAKRPGPNANAQSNTAFTLSIKTLMYCVATLLGKKCTMRDVYLAVQLSVINVQNQF